MNKQFEYAYPGPICTELALAQAYYKFGDKSVYDCYLDLYTRIVNIGTTPTREVIIDAFSDLENSLYNSQYFIDSFSSSCVNNNAASQHDVAMALAYSGEHNSENLERCYLDILNRIHYQYMQLNVDKITALEFQVNLSKFRADYFDVISNNSTILECSSKALSSFVKYTFNSLHNTITPEHKFGDKSIGYNSCMSMDVYFIIDEFYQKLIKLYPEAGKLGDTRINIDVTKHSAGYTFSQFKLSNFGVDGFKDIK